MNYRYKLGEDISMEDVQESLMLAVLAMECLYGSARARLELSHSLDPIGRVCSINASSEIGRELNCLFVGFLQREFGQDSFTVQQLPAPTTGLCSPSQN